MHHGKGKDWDNSVYSVMGAAIHGTTSDSE